MKRTESKRRGGFLAVGLIALALCLLAPGAAFAASGGAAEEIFSILEDWKQDPSTFEDYDKLATIAYARGNYEDALAYLDGCLSLCEGDAPLAAHIWTQKGAIYFEHLSLPDEALSALNTAIGLSPDNPQTLMLRAKLYTEKKEYGRASTDLQAYVRLLPEDAEAWRALSSAQRGNSDKERADESLARANALAGNEANAVLTAARLSGLQGDLAAAEAGYTRYLETEADEKGKVHFLRAVARMQTGQLEAAVADLETALAQEHAEPALCYEYLSSCHFALENHAEAVGAGKECIAIASDKPLYSTLYQRIGISSILLGQPEAAIEYLTVSITLDGSLSGSHYYRALAWMNQGAYDEAVSDFTESVSRGEAVQLSAYNRGLCHLYRDEMDAAIDDLRLALTMDEDAGVSEAAEEILWQLALQYMAEESI